MLAEFLVTESRTTKAMNAHNCGEKRSFSFDSVFIYCKVDVATVILFTPQQFMERHWEKNLNLNFLRNDPRDEGCSVAIANDSRKTQREKCCSHCLWTQQRTFFPPDRVLLAFDVNLPHQELTELQVCQGQSELGETVFLTVYGIYIYPGEVCEGARLWMEPTNPDLTAFCKVYHKVFTCC